MKIPVPKSDQYEIWLVFNRPAIHELFGVSEEASKNVWKEFEDKEKAFLKELEAAPDKFIEIEDKK